MTNKELVDNDKVFQTACSLANVPITMRQASKYFNSRGSAFKHRKEAIRVLKGEKNEKENNRVSKMESN